MKLYYLPSKSSSFIWKTLVLSLCMIAFAHLGFSQTQTITGTIQDENQNPLVGASVLIKGTTQGAITTDNGRFTVSANPSSDTLVVAYIGYATQEIPLAGRTDVTVGLEESISFLDEVVTVAYGTQKKATVTGAVAGVKGVDLVEAPVVNLGTSLAGRIPGLVVIQTSGEPGADDANINIRGVNTLGNSSPLIVIDGIPDRDGGLSRLNPQNIEDISVLKDASAAIYGARAANGVILITTKRGKTGKASVQYDLNLGWTQPTIVPEMSNAVEYATIMNEIPIYRSIPVNEWGTAWESIQNTGVYDSPTPGVGTLNANFSPEAVRLHGEGSDPWGYPDEDWFDAAFKNWAFQQRHNLQISGGTEKFKYLASLNYLDQDAVYNNSATFYRQYTGRVNLDINVNPYITTRLGVLLRREDRNFATQGAGAIFRMLMRGRPTEPAVWPNGRPGPDIENGQNPYVVTTNATGYDRQPRDFIQTNATVEITNPWVEGLKLTLMGSLDNQRLNRRRWETPWELYYWDRVSFEADGVTPLLEPAVRSNFTDPRLRQFSEEVLNHNLTALLSYDKTFGDHTLNAMVGVTREEFTGDNFNAFRRNFISPAIDQLFAGGALQQETGGGAYERARLGYYGRLQYNFKERYLVEFIWRYDGSYIFPENDRFGFFPGILAGWNVSNEPFFNVPFIDYLKVRGSYGEMGNDQVFFNGRLQEYAFLSTYSFDEYPINNQVVTTLEETVLANPSFTWERARNLNIGLDATFLNNQIDLTLEYFLNRRDQILIQETGSTPASSGISNLLPPVNAGEFENRGFEFSVNYNGFVNDKFNFRIGLNGGYAKNEVIFLDETPGIPDYQRLEGKPFGAYLVYLSDGVFEDQAAIEANTVDYSGVTAELIPGDMRFQDVDGNGVIDADDRVRLEENITPTFNFGGTIRVSYGPFDLSALFQGATGARFRFQTESGDIGNYTKYSFDNRWRIDNPSSVHPRLASRNDTYYTGGGFGQNDYWLFSKDYIRLKNLEIGYRLPTSIVNKAKLTGLRVYVSGFNLVTFADQDIWDPEAENSAGTFYPLQRVLNTGVSITF